MVKCLRQNKGKQKIVPLAIVGGIILLVLVIILAVFVFGDKRVEVPDFSGMSLNEAFDTAGKEGLIINEGQGEISETVPEGYVVSQSVEAGERVEEDTVVVVNLSIGLGKSNVPELIGKTPQEAEKLLAECGYKGEGKECDGVRPAGVIIDQSEKEGKELERGEVIGYSISRGNMAYVPNVCGKDAESATAIIANAGFQVSYAACESSKPAGIVAKQSRSGIAYIGSTITLYVSVGEDNEYEDYY